MSRRALIWGATCAAALSFSAPSRAVPIITSTELYSDWSSPTNVSSPPFNFAGTTGVSLNLNGSQVADSFSDPASGQSFTINATVTHVSSSGIDDGEPFGGTFADHVNSEIGTWDDAGIFSEDLDTDFNVDFNGSSPSFVLFALPTFGLTTLIVAEDAGLDPFRMVWCEDATCSGGLTILFDGFTAGVLSDLLDRPDFGAGDTGEEDIDQAFVFNFQTPAKGFLGFTRNGNPDGEKLELDFVGGVTAVPEPGTLFLVGAGLLGLATWKGRHQRA